jgi:hypothetical protein
MAPESEDAEPMGAAARQDDSDGSDSDSDSSDADAFELSEQDMAAMQSLEEALQADPYNYDNHVRVPTNSQACAAAPPFVRGNVCRHWSSRLVVSITRCCCVLQYIAVLRKGRLKERLKGARRSMQERFPLIEQLWTEWLDDEMSASSPAEMTQLFELAVGDYLSVPLWRKYLE